MKLLATVLALCTSVLSAVVLRGISQGPAGMPADATTAAVLLHELPDAPFATWRSTVDELTAMGPVATPALLEALETPDRNTRTAAAQALGAIAGFDEQPGRGAAAAALLVLADEPLATRTAAFERMRQAANL